MFTQVSSPNFFGTCEFIHIACLHKFPYILAYVILCKSSCFLLFLSLVHNTCMNAISAAPDVLDPD